MLQYDYGAALRRLTERTWTRPQHLNGCRWTWPAMVVPGLGPDLGPLGLDRVGWACGSLVSGASDPPPDHWLVGALDPGLSGLDPVADGSPVLGSAGLTGGCVLLVNLTVQELLACPHPPLSVPVISSWWCSSAPWASDHGRRGGGLGRRTTRAAWRRVTWWC